MDGARRDAAASCCCVLLALAVYRTTLDAGFVYDDRRAILTNPDLLPRTPWTKLFENDFWGTPLTDSGSHGSYRPLSVLSFRLNYLFGGFCPWGYHLANVLLHCSGTYLLIKVARLVLPQKRKNVSSTVAGLLFAAHPIHTETVAGVVGRADLAACNLFFLSLISYVNHVKYRDKRCCLKSENYSSKSDRRKYQKLVFAFHKTVTSCNWPKRSIIDERIEIPDMCCWRNTVKIWLYLTFTIVLALGAMLSKETGITVLGVCFVYDLAYSTTTKVKQSRSLSILVGALSLILLARLQTRTPQFSTADNPTAREPSLVTRILTFSYLPVFNFWLLIFPNTLSFDWGMDAIPRVSSISDKRNIMSLLFYSLMIKLVLKCIKTLQITEKHEKSHHFCSVCRNTSADIHTHSCRVSNNNNVNLNQVSTCLCAPNTRRTTKRSSAAILLSISVLVLPFLPATNMFFYVGFVVAERVLYIPSAGLCLLVGLVVGWVWGEKIKRRLCCAILTVVFLSFCARTAFRNEDWHDEEALYSSAVNVNPPKAYGNLGSVLSAQGRHAEAETAFRRALQHRPNMADVHYNLGILLQSKNKLDEAILSYQRAIHFRPSLALAYVNLGAALIASGRCQEAAAILRQGSRLDGTGLKDRREHENAKVSALLQLGALYSDQGRLQRALATYREAAYSLPDHYPPQSVFNVLGETLARLQQDEEAERWYRAALDAQPDHVPAHITYGKLLAKNGSRAGEAEEWFRKAQRLAPNDASVFQHYGEFLASRRRYKEAASHYEKAAELSPLDHELTVAAATAMRQASRNAEAEKWYRRAVALKPMDARSHTNLGAILHLNGKYREAAESYREALKLQPNDVTTLTNLHKLHTVMT